MEKQDKKVLNIVLFEPEIPQNTGNVARTCAATGARLHLVRPFGFEITDRNLKRAGLDYWKDLDVSLYESYEDFLEKNPGARIWYATTKARTCYSDAVFADGDYLMFGKERLGIPEEILVENPDRCIRIPMVKDNRSLNLSNSVAVVLYEALRQQEFPGLEREGELHRLSW